MLTYLALGDSYTIGEGVDPILNFPNQLTTLLEEDAGLFDAPTIIAKTGWTTRDLISAIDAAELHPPYNIVTLLIGVNNQYQGRRLEEYEAEFEYLLEKAIELAGGDPDHVFVISIPDWSATPFAVDLDRYTIRKSIDKFNAINNQLTEKAGSNYIEITSAYRDVLYDKSLVASDNLHPAPKEYARWATRLVDEIMPYLEREKWKD